MKSNILLIILLVSFIALGCSRDEPALSVDPTPTPATVKMNEVYSQGTAVAPDWIEIYNPTSAEVNLGGYKIYDLGGKNGSKAKKEIPAGTLVPANGFFVLIADTVDATGLELSALGETLWMENASGVVIDSIIFPALGVDTSYARQPDGSSTWQTLTPVTKGTLNSLLPVVMNEIFAGGVKGVAGDWIEVYNPSAISIDLSGFKIYDIGGQSGTKAKKGFPAGTIVPANGFFVIVTDTTIVGDASDFGLSGTSGETVWLENASGTIIDRVAFPSMVTTESYIRNPDGATTWQKTTTITRGTSNLP